jgi:hypothetical protein
MSPLGVVLIIVLIIVLFGGIGPTFYSGAPWRYGFGYGHGGVGVVTIILIVVLFCALTGRF